MLYTLLKDERIVTGPRDWNPKYFEYFLKNDCGVETSLSDPPVVEPLVFNDNVKLVPTRQEQPPVVDPMFEVLSGPIFSYDTHTEVVSTPQVYIDQNGNEVATTSETVVQNKIYKSSYVVQELPLSVVKNNLLSQVANLRWIKETTAISRNINEKQITIYTDNNSRTSYTQALMLADDTYSAQWKFTEGFFVLNKYDLQLIVNEVLTHVQNCFDWEANKTSEINEKTSIEELKQIILE